MSGDTKAKDGVNFQILNVGLLNAVICTRLLVPEATRRLNAESPTGLSSKWGFSGKARDKSPCPDGQGKTHYVFYC